MSRCRRLRHAMESSATHRDRALFGSTGSGIGAAETGTGRPEAGGVHRERAPRGLPHVGSHMAAVTASCAATGDGSPGAHCVAHASARTTLPAVTNVGELDPVRGARFSVQGRTSVRPGDVSPARSVTCAVVLWKACCGELQLAIFGRRQHHGLRPGAAIFRAAGDREAQAGIWRRSPFLGVGGEAPATVKKFPK